MVTVSSVPITVKIRTGISETKATAHTLIPKLKTWDVALTTVSINVNSVISSLVKNLSDSLRKG